VPPARRASLASTASFTDQAYYTIRDLILRGKLPMGAALSRRKLAMRKLDGAPRGEALMQLS